MHCVAAWHVFMSSSIYFFCRLVLFGELLFKASLISAHLRGWKHAVFKRQLFSPGLQVMIIFLNKFLDSSIRCLVNNTSGCSERKERCFVLSRPTVQEPNRINLQAVKKIKLYLYFSYGRVTESASHNKTKWDKTEKAVDPRAGERHRMKMNLKWFIQILK